MKADAMATPMASKEAVDAATPLIILRNVFGMQPGQTLTDFVKETLTVKQDAAFIAECRTYAAANLKAA